MIKNIFVIDGANGTGKSDMIEYIKSNFTIKGYIEVITKYTTRLARLEEEGKELDLDFIEAEQFNEHVLNKNFLFYRYENHRYGFYTDQINKALETHKNIFIIIRNKDIARKLIELYPNCKVVFVHIYTDPVKVIDRLKNEGFNQNEIDYRLNRLNTSWDDYLKHFHTYSEVLINNSTRTDYHRLIDYLIEKYNFESSFELVIDNAHHYPLLKPLIGFKKEIQKEFNNYNFEKNIFLMMKYRSHNLRKYQFIKKIIENTGYSCIRADQPEVNITKNVYNPLAVIYLCKFGIALFDEAEDGSNFSPNVTYELGMMHTQGKECLILKHKSLPQLPFDLLKDLYVLYNDNLELEEIIGTWLKTTVFPDMKET
ncbi:MAG: hypothetical protein WAT21_10655 [Saprospiraceae bacterium]